MEFLEGYDAISANDIEGQKRHLIGWLRGNWRKMYAELREYRPVFKTPLFTMVTRATDVSDILAQPDAYSVRFNQRTMDPSVGPFMLARDLTDLNWSERGFMQAVLKRGDLPALRQTIRDWALDALPGSDGEADIVPTLGRHIPARVVQEYFGFDAPQDALLRWSFATQHAMFRNLTQNQAVLDECIKAGQEMRAWLRPFLSEKCASPDPQTTVDKLVALGNVNGLLLEAERMVSNVCGLLVGAIETSSQAIVQVADQLLTNPEWLAQAEAYLEDEQTFDEVVFEALRFNPITTLQFRLAERDDVIGVGTPYATEVAAGDLIAVCTGSAMFDPDTFVEPEQFRLGRPSHAYLHFGAGHHSCLGEHVGRVLIPETLRALISKGNLGRHSGSKGQIDFADGPFPEHFWVSWGVTQCS